MQADQGYCLRILVEHLHVAVRGRGVKVVVQFLPLDCCHSLGHFCGGRVFMVCFAGCVACVFVVGIVSIIFKLAWRLLYDTQQLPLASQELYK